MQDKLVYQFGTYALDSESLELTNGGEPVEVEPQVFSLLVCLIENRDRVMSKDELIEQVWGGRIVSDSSLNSRINSLRKAVGDNGKVQAVIKTFPRRGFRFVADLEEAAAETVSGEPTGALDRPSIIVMPFKNLSNDPEQDYFSDGISEDIIAALSRFHWFFVIASGTSFSFKGQAIDVKQVAADIDVRYVLEGSVRKSGERIRISVQLSDGVNGTQLWAERYDRDMEDIFAVQDEITQMVVGAVEPELAGAEQRLATSKPPQNLDAWDIFQRAMYLLNQRTEEDVKSSLPLFEKAIELDPGNAAFHSGFAYAHGLTTVQGWTDDIERSQDAALLHGRRAVQIDQDDALAHMVLGVAHFQRQERTKRLRN